MDDFNIYEEKIIRILLRGRRALTTSKVSEYTGISYNTTKQYLQRLYRKKVIERAIRGNRIYWWID